MKVFIVFVFLFYTVKIGLCKSANDYPVKATVSNYVSEIDFEGYEKLAGFRQQLNAQIKKGPNFAEKYFVAFISCGSSCQGNVIINLKNGKIIDQITSCDGMKYQLESGVFIVNPKNEESTYQMCPTQYFQLINEKMVELK